MTEPKESSLIKPIFPVCTSVATISILPQEYAKWCTLVQRYHSAADLEMRWEEETSAVPPSPLSKLHCIQTTKERLLGSQGYR